MADSKSRQRDLRKKRKEAGFRQLVMWVHEDDRREVAFFAQQVRKARFKKMGMVE